MTRKCAAWTVMVYMNADNDLETYGLADFDEMARVGSTDRVNIVVQFDRKGKIGDPVWGETLRFHVEKGMTAAPENAVDRSLGEQNMGDKEVLRRFVEWAMRSYEAERYVLVIWGHGQGWALTDLVDRAEKSAEIGEDADDDRLPSEDVIECRPDTAPPLETLRDVEEGIDSQSRTRLPNVAMPSAMWYVYPDDTNGGDRLYNSELQEALEGLLGGRKLDLIVFNSCLMAMIEVAYAIRRVARVMVASEELMPNTGLNHCIWLHALAAKPELDAVGLGKAIVASYRKTYLPRRPEVTLSATDLTKIEDLADVIDVLACSMRDNLRANLDGIVWARKKCKPYDRDAIGTGIDIANFCDALADSDVDAAVKRAAKTAGDKARELVLDHVAGDDRYRGYGSFGLAIYFPETDGNFRQDPDHTAYSPPFGTQHRQYPIEFVECRKWPVFLADYLSLVP